MKGLYYPPIGRMEYFDQLWLPVMVSVCCKKKCFLFFWLWVGAIISCGYKDKYLETIMV